MKPDDKERKTGRKTTLKVIFWIIVTSAVFSLIPFYLIIKLIGRPIYQAGTVYLIIAASNFVIFYIVTMTTYSHRKKMKQRNKDFQR